MDNFNLEKYQGKWYEHKFHDWTQFKEVYDTTLSIKVGSVFGGRVEFFASYKLKLTSYVHPVLCV
jgi:hypothetical protein